MAEKKTEEKKPESIIAERKVDFEKKKRKQLIWFFGIVIAVFAIILLVYFYFQGLNKFNYDGLQWEKLDYSGGLILYHSNFPIVLNGEISAYYNLYLRLSRLENQFCF